MSTPHMDAKKEDIAKTVLMPGDPLRAKYWAENYLKNVKLVNTTRNMLGFTGTYNDVPITIMGSGMGLCSIGIYSYELFTVYDVDNIVRLGTCGCYNDSKFNLLEPVLIDSAYSSSSYAREQSGFEGDITYADDFLLSAIRNTAKEKGIYLKEARTHSADVFYYQDGREVEARRFVRDVKRCDVVECESFALFHNAKMTGKKAVGLMTVVDLLETNVFATREERERGNAKMIEIALDTFCTKRI